jgi:hypothetical protein
MEQGGVLFLNEDDGVWELILPDGDNPARVWKTEGEALKELARDGWKIEGPFRMRPRQSDLPKVLFTGYGLSRPIH